MLNSQNSGPIPGANYTSDTRNYPWHRPPEIETYDATVEYVMGLMQEEETAEVVYSLMGIGRPLTNIVAGLMMQSIARGKFQIDMAILAAGPVYRYLQILADNEGISYESGLDKKRIPITSTTMKALLGIVDEEDEEEDASEAPTEAAAMPVGGLMGSPEPTDESVAPAEEQAAMLGMNEEEEEA